MRTSLLSVALLSLLTGLSAADRNFSTQSYFGHDLDSFQKRPDGCPPCDCFNCNVPGNTCLQFADCIGSSGKCKCPTGFGDNDCSKPLCGSPAMGDDRPVRRPKQHACKCEEGWEGINCNVCNSDRACDALMPTKVDGVCYKDGLVQKKNFQMCDVTNKKILDQLDPRKPQVTFSCDKSDKACNFQFWVAQKEAFYCSLDGCEFDLDAQSNRNITNYKCDHLKCRCIKGGTLCGEKNSIDLSDFLEQEIKGPATFKTVSTEGGNSQDGSYFSEPNMDDLIMSVFGDSNIKMNCNSGECLYKTEVPEYTRPTKDMSTPLIAGIIAGCAFFVVIVILLVWFFWRRYADRRGPIHLGDDDDENARLQGDHKPASLHFENVSYNLNGKHLLSGVQGAVRPGELLAIMGASGAGKTTFLDILARKNKRGVIGGEFYVNGEKVLDDDFRSVIGFVDQEDSLLPTLTVHEVILESALLRLPKDMHLIDKEQKVEDVEKQLGIFHIRDQIIGSEEGNNRGISGGEKRRVGIACELVTSPSILFLDEPTSGLDAYNAFNVVESLVNLVKTYNRTVVFTIHQPRSNIVALFDQLILLAKGRAVYSGPSSNCQTYFDSIGYSCPPGFNIADYLIDLTMHASAERSPMDFLEAENPSAQTRSSSVMAVKSVASTSNFSGQYGAATPDSSKRLPNPRRASVKQLQEQQLYTRKNVEPRDGAETPTSSRTGEEDGPLDDTRETSQAWLHLSKQSGAPPPQILEDPHHLPPDANATGTDLDTIVAAYNNSDVASSLRSDILDTINTANQSNGRTPTTVGNGVFANGHSAVNGTMKGYRKVGLLGQIRILSLRTWRNLYRNPMLLLTHYAISIILAVLLGFLFFDLTPDIPGFQNRLGLLFFILALFGFSTLTSLNVFSTERFIFIRERAKGYYSPISYFIAKVFFDIVPLRLIPPILLGIIVYPMSGLGLEAGWPEFFKFLLFLILFNFAATAICLFLGIVFRNNSVANLIGSLVMLFSLLFAGLLLNHNTVPGEVMWLQWLSIFHYALEGLLVNEVLPLSLSQTEHGLDINVPGAIILSEFGFNNKALAKDLSGLAIFTAGFVVIAYGAMHFLLVERR